MTCAVQVALPYENKVRFSCQYRFRGYWHITQSIGEKREDKKHTFNVVVTKEVFDSFE